MTKKIEPILVLDMEFAPEALNVTEGPVRVVQPEALQGIDHTGFTLMPRWVAEDDPRFRQLIPYAILMDKEGRVLTYRRCKGAGEQRLVGKCSIGFGGHIDLADVRLTRRDTKVYIDPWASLAYAARRELAEELSGVEPASVPTTEAMATIGALVGAATDVDRVHLGVAFGVIARDPRFVSSNEPEIELLGWQRPQDLDVSQYEAWSAAVVARLLAEAP